MIDITSISIISVVIAATSVVIAAISTIIHGTRAEKQRKSEIETRQAQLFMGLWETGQKPEFLRQYYEVIHNFKWDDYDDWKKKYGPKTNIEAYTATISILGFFEGIGVLLEQNLIDTNLVYKLFHGFPKRFWEKMEPIFKEMRERTKSPETAEWTEYLCNEMKKREQQLAKI